ncbi:MAG TPA: M1 family aminopeptidase [Pyrinomonadaceae bacterium]|jgi:aminopeptidase N|nr:M1 family aminopeptidase [Pyrinomonadaceae bacterium]
MMARSLLFVVLLLTPLGLAVAQIPPIEPGVSHDLAIWRSARYSDVRYKLDLTLEKMSPVLKGTIEIRVKVSTGTQAPTPASPHSGDIPPIMLDWRKLPGHEKDSTVSNVKINGAPIRAVPFRMEVIIGPWRSAPPPPAAPSPAETYVERDEHLIFDQGVRLGENVITLDFTSPILTSGSAITRYIDKEDGSEYIYSLFVPSDASTAFPVFDQPDLKARFSLDIDYPYDWTTVSNSLLRKPSCELPCVDQHIVDALPRKHGWVSYEETKPISTYVFAFAAGPWTQVTKYTEWNDKDVTWIGTGGGNGRVSASPAALPMHVYVRKSQSAKFQPHAAEVFRLTREGVKYLETYFDYKFPWPKYDLVLIPEFPFGGMEHAGATFLRESAVIFPTEPTKGDQISRANLIFHETAHQWFGDTVTMRWFDDLWLKEGFAEFMAYKTLAAVMPEANAWKVFYERNKQAAYATDSTRGTTPIYQPIANLSAAKSAYGNIVYRKAPSFLRQAEFYLGEDKFQTAVRAFLKKHEYANAGWEDLVGEFEGASGRELKEWATTWVKTPGVAIVGSFTPNELCWMQAPSRNNGKAWDIKVQAILRFQNGSQKIETEVRRPTNRVGFECTPLRSKTDKPITFGFPNYGDYGYGIFLLDDKSRDYILKHIGEEKDPFLRSMMWGALWDSVREAELDPREYVELVIRQLGGKSDAFTRSNAGMSQVKGNSSTVETPKGVTLTFETDETIVSSILGRVGTAMNYYVDAKTRDVLAPRLEAVLLDRMQHAETPGRRITFYRAFVSNASTEKGKAVLKQMLAQSTQPRVSVPTAVAGGSATQAGSPRSDAVPLRAKDKFDIVTRLTVLGDPDAPKLLADLEKTETGDDAKRYAYAAHAAFGTVENKAKFWNDFVNNKDISESWIEAAIGPFNSIRHADLTQQYLGRALAELPNLKRTRKIFFINNWLSAWIGGQRDEKALNIVNKFLADNPTLDNDLRLKVLENVDVIERAVKIRKKYP